MAIVDSLLIALGLDTKEAQRELNNLKGSFNELLKIGGSLVGIFSISSMVNSFIETNDKVNQLSMSLGENYEEIQAWGEAVKHVGGSIGGLESSLTSLNAGIQQIAVTGSSSLLPVLNRMGISIRGSDGELKKGTEILRELSSQFSGMSAGQAQLFGKQLGLDGGTINLLKQGSEGLNKILESQRKLGIYTEEDGILTREFVNSLDDLKQSLMSIFAVFSRSVLPVLKIFNEVMTDVALFVRKYENFIKIFFITLSTIFAFRLAPAILKVMSAFISLKGSTAFLFILGTAIAMLIDDFITWKNGGDALFGSFYKWFSEANIWVKILLSSVGLLVGAFAVNKVTDFGSALIGMIKNVSGVLKASPLWLLLTSATFLYNSKDIGRWAGNKLDNLFNGDFYDNAKTNPSNQEIQAVINKSPSLKAKYEARQQSNTVSIGEIKITTQATDSVGIAKELPNAIKNNNLVSQANWGGF